MGFFIYFWYICFGGGWVVFLGGFGGFGGVFFLVCVSLGFLLFGFFLGGVVFQRKKSCRTRN